MTVQTTPGFLQNLSYPAAIFRQFASAPFSSGGVLSSAELAVSAQSTPNMSVQIGAGRAVVPGTNVSPPSGLSFTTQGMYEVLNDGTITVTIATSNPTNPRIDAVYVSVQDSYYSGTSNTALAGVVTGTPAASPSAPAIPSNSILLAYVAVAANATTIVSGNITAQAQVAGLLTGPIGAVSVAPAQTLTASMANVNGASVTGTTNGSAIYVRSLTSAANGNSGNNRIVELQILCDGALVGSTSPQFYLPYVANASPYYSPWVAVTHTPAPGSHTWQLQATALAASAVVIGTAALEVTQL